MSEMDPYQPPKSLSGPPVDDPDGTAHLAGRGQRFAAAMIDGIIGTIFALLIMWAMNAFEYIERGEDLPGHLEFLTIVIGFAFFSAVHFVTLKKYGQTIGKRVVKIRIARMDGQKPDVGHILVVRYLPMSAVQVLPGIGTFLGIVDALFIFRRDRRCVHDLLAGTQVVRCE